MTFVAILRELWRARSMVFVAALIALMAGFAMSFRIMLPPNVESRQHTVGVGSVTALIDTPSSQVVDLGGETGSDVVVLSSRATLLASLMTSAPLKDEIAERAGVAPGTLITPPPESTGPASAIPPQAGVSGALINEKDPRASILKAIVPMVGPGQLPMVAVETQAPSAAAAQRLAGEAIAVLKQHLESLATEEGIPAKRRLVVKQLGPARSETVRRGPGLILVVLLMLVVFGAGIGFILGIGFVVRNWRVEPVAPGDPRLAVLSEPAFEGDQHEQEDGYAREAEPYEAELRSPFPVR
jgi:hypothetical protein